MGVRRLDVFEQRLGITRHVLSDRLRKLVEYDILKKVAYQQRLLRDEYRLTECGLDLHSVVLALVSWSDKYMADEHGRHKACGHIMHPVAVCAEAVTARDIEVETGPKWNGNDEVSI